VAQQKATRSVETYWAAALSYNKSLGIPARWRVAERIPSTSQYMNTHRSDHVLLLQDFKHGRLKRQRGQFLCNAKVTNPAAHQALNVVDIDADRSKRHKVTCSKCLAMAKRFQK
jgi:hypothetical protein